MDQKVEIVPLVLEKLTGAKKAAIKRTASKAGISVEQYLQKVNSGLKWCVNCKNFLCRTLFHNYAERTEGKHPYLLQKLCASQRTRSKISTIRPPLWLCKEE